MAFSSQCQCFFFLLLLALASSALEAHARESKFFSKITRPEPTNPNLKLEAETISPSLPAEQATSEEEYGLFGQEEKETYQYPPTTTNPTKSAPKKFTYVQSNGVSKEFEMPYKNNNGYHYGAGEKQGISDTRFLENGRYFYDIEAEKKNNGNGYSNNVEFYNNNNNNNNESEEEDEEEEKYEKEGHGTGEKRGITNTRFMENGRYFYDIGAEKKNNGNGNSNKVEFHNNNYENKEEEKEEQKYKKEGFGVGEKQGMSDTRFLENGRYFHDINAEKNHNYNGYGNNVEFYNNNNEENYEPEKFSYHSSEGQIYNNYGKESRKYNGNGNGYSFRSTPNKFPNFEFDSMEEYEKYEQNRSHQNVYEP